MHFVVLNFFIEFVDVCFIAKLSGICGVFRTVLFSNVSLQVSIGPVLPSTHSFTVRPQHTPTAVTHTMVEVQQSSSVLSNGTTSMTLSTKPKPAPTRRSKRKRTITPFHQPLPEKNTNSTSFDTLLKTFQETTQSHKRPSMTNNSQEPSGNHVTPTDLPPFKKACLTSSATSRPLRSPLPLPTSLPSGYHGTSSVNVSKVNCAPDINFIKLNNC